MDLFSITIIEFHFNPTSSFGRPVLSKFYQRLTSDPKITSESNRKDQGKFNTTQVVYLICHGVHELLHQLLIT